MYRNYRFRNFVRFAVLTVCVLGFTVNSVVPSAWAQNPQTQGQVCPIRRVNTRPVNARNQ
jgi:hypothetical protein